MIYNRSIVKQEQARNYPSIKNLRVKDYSERTGNKTSVL